MCLQAEGTAQPSNEFRFFFFESLFAHLRPRSFVAVGTRVCFRDRGKIKNCAPQFPPGGLKYKKRISFTIWNQLGQYENKRSQKRPGLFFFPVFCDSQPTRMSQISRALRIPLLFFRLSSLSLSLIPDFLPFSLVNM